MAAKDPRDAVITGIGLMTALAEGVAENLRLLTAAERPVPLTDTETFAPYPVHPLVDIDLSNQIPKRGDQRQMENWQRYGTYAAGLALSDAGIAGNAEILDRTNLIVSAGSGERDPEVDAAILAEIEETNDPGRFLNEHLLNDLRPTLFLAQLSNLLAGNISIVHNVIGSSRTFMGEELAGAMAPQWALRQIKSGNGDVFLVGGAYNGPRPDMMFFLALGNYLYSGTEVVPLWQRLGRTDGVVCGSMGAFLTIESREHAEARGAHIYAKLEEVVADRGRRDDAGDVAKRVDEQIAVLDRIAGDRPIGLISAASGAGPALDYELAMIRKIAAVRPTYVRGCATMIGHGIEAQIPAGIALAAAALDAGTFYPPFEDGDIEQPAGQTPDMIAVTGWGHWRGETLTIVSADR
ncbi:MAG: beta-ketoacyl-ACP synthase [Hyphomicrobiales bacterium]|nr:beta-ketoacyl-ACP synthase [Hyphomicrobiales bacterium]